MKRAFKIGTRGSDLALTQTRLVRDALLRRAPNVRFEIKIIATSGDRFLDKAISKIGDPRLFTADIEDALVSGEIDMAVHSLKDTPTERTPGLKIAAIVDREMPNEVFISDKYSSLDALPAGAVVATGSLRRRSQLLRYRPDLRTVDIRGNVPTRIEKASKRGLDGLILAYAGVHRLGLDDRIREVMPIDRILPAAGQGAIAVEARENDAEVCELLASINRPDIESCVTAERAFLHALDGGCQVPIGALAVIEDGDLHLKGFVGSLDGGETLTSSMTGNADAAETLGKALAEVFKDKGALPIIEKARIELRDLESEVV